MVQPIIANNNISVKIVIIPDAGEIFTFVDSEKVLLQLDLVTTGLSAHASMPNEGRNAILYAMKVYEELLYRACTNSRKCY